MTKDRFCKLFLSFIISFSCLILIITQNYKYISSKTFILLIFINILFIIIFFLKKIRFIIFLNFLIFFFLVFLINLFLYFKNPAQVGASKKYEFIKNNSSSAKKLYPSIPPIIHLKDENALLPLSGLSQVRTVTSNESGYWGIFDSDEYGFNNDVGQIKKLQETKLQKFIFLGDSMTMGDAVNREENFVNLLNDGQNIDALNLAYGGNGLLLSLATYQEYGKNIKNAKIFLCFYEGNDFYEFEVEEKRNKILLQYYNDNFSQNLLNKNFEKDIIVEKKLKKEFENVKKNNGEKVSIFFNEIIKLGQVRKLFGILNNKKESYAFNEENFLEFNKIIQILKKNTIQNNSELVFVYIPSREHFFYGNPYDEPYKNILQIVKKNNIEIIDLYLELLNSGNPMLYFPSGTMRHFNKMGHKKIYEVIKNKM